MSLSCALDIIFLRPEDPGSLVLQGGDLDGRMKTLFDALRIPSKQEEDASGITPADNPLQVLLESDTLISDLSIKTRRLLGVCRPTKHPARRFCSRYHKELYLNQALQRRELAKRWLSYLSGSS